MTYNVAECFHSIQGEGVWTGTPMLFVRLAGCNVGKYINLLEVKGEIGVRAADFPLYDNMTHSICTTIDGQRFLCDTDYHKSTEMDVEAIIKECYEYHICVTGGEPFLHNLEPLFERAWDECKTLHIETSGTKPIPAWTDNEWVWLTCCPKEGFLAENYLATIREFKFLVGPSFQEDTTPTLVSPTIPIFVQPINGVSELDEANLARCLELLKKHPDWRLSMQAHKYLGLR